MSYTKTQWVDNTTPINETNLNKIEKGIYDNSLVADAVNANVKPTGDAYASAELTEGQITDVIGVNDIVIKGQTSQNGEPTPSSPVDVNVVSGSNVVNTSNKNLFDKDTEIKGKLIVTTTGAIQNNSVWNISQFIPVKSGTELCFSYQTQGSGQIELVEYDKNQNILGGEAPSITQKYTKTISNNTKFVRVGYRNDLTCDNLQLEYGSNRTTYEPHQGKELPLDLGNIELCKIGDYQDYFYKSGSKWYLHKEVGKKVYTGNGTISNPSTNRYNINDINLEMFKSSGSDYFCDKYITTSIYSTNAEFDNYVSNYNFALGLHPNGVGLRIKDTRGLSNANFIEDIIGLSIYGALKTSTDTEITGTLKEQLEAIYNAPLYEQTNITQENNDLPMILDITACKDNINGIKAFIRK